METLWRAFLPLRHLLKRSPSWTGAVQDVEDSNFRFGLRNETALAVERCAQRCAMGRRRAAPVVEQPRDHAWTPSVLAHGRRDDYPR
jgi:hypothetical protein